MSNRAYKYDKEENVWFLVSFPPKGYIWFGSKPTSELVEMFNHQYGIEPNNPLDTVDISGAPLVIVQFDPTNEIIFVQQTDGGSQWNQPYAYQYNHSLKSWGELAPKQDNKKSLVESLDLKVTSLFATGSCSTSYSYLLGGGVQANINLGKILGFTSLSFIKGPPKNNRVKSQQAFSLAMGVGYPLPLSERMTLIPEIGYGVLLFLLEAEFGNTGIYEPERFIDQQMQFSLYLTYALNERYRLFVAPVGVLFFEKERLGFMYGCQAGLRFTV